LEAIAAAGDLAITGRRHDILLIRTEGDVRKFVRMDMTSTELFKSPYFYLKQRDVIYVKPTKFKIQSSDNQLTRNISIISSVISLALVFLSLRNIK
jgi:polysaccharide export outer membrane protein